MRLVYTATQLPVQIGDRVTIGDYICTVDYFRPPHKPSSSGKVTVTKSAATGRSDHYQEYYVGIIGAEWIDREDQR